MSDVLRNDSAGHDYTCPECGFTSTGWSSAALAEARGQQHAEEHASGEAMPELAVFRREHNLDADGEVH